MHYVYVLHSDKDGKLYTGATGDLRKRIEEHNKGKVDSTTNRRPFDLIYYEACLKKEDAFRREKYLKSGNGKIYLRNRLKKYLEQNSNGINQLFAVCFFAICKGVQGRSPWSSAKLCYIPNALERDRAEKPACSSQIVATTRQMQKSSGSAHPHFGKYLRTITIFSGGQCQLF